MMAAFNVTDVDLTDYGYPETTKFSDPMAPLFLSKKYTGTDMGQIRDVLLPYFQNLNAYPNPKEVEKALDDYYKNPKTKSSSSTSSTMSTTVPSTLATVTTTPTTKATSKTTSKAATATPKCDDKGKGKSTCK